VDDRPVTRFAQSPDGVSIAYQVSGDGERDLLLRAGMGVPIDLFWDEPGFVRFAKRLGGFTRLVMSDLRGVGASGGDLRDSVVDEIGEIDVTSVLVRPRSATPPTIPNVSARWFSSIRSLVSCRTTTTRGEFPVSFWNQARPP
jgi:hypothetical protein